MNPEQEAKLHISEIHSQINKELSVEVDRIKSLYDQLSSHLNDSDSDDTVLTQLANLLHTLVEKYNMLLMLVRELKEVKKKFASSNPNPHGLIVAGQMVKNMLDNVFREILGEHYTKDGNGNYNVTTIDQMNVMLRDRFSESVRKAKMEKFKKCGLHKK